MKSTLLVRAARRLLVLIVMMCLTTGNAYSAVSASPDTTMPSQHTNHNFTGGYTIIETVAFDPSFGPWVKHLINGPQGQSSGQNILIDEMFTNTGSVPWTDWDEQVLSRTDIPGGPGDEVGFLFHDSSLVVQADYGSGFVLLTPGLDYTLVPTLYSGPPTPGNNFHWEAISIFFAPGREIDTGDRLRIRKDIFEVFGDADPWRPGEEALVGQFPNVPEPSGLLLVAMGAAVASSRRTGPAHLTSP